MSTTSHSHQVKNLRKAMLKEITALRTAVNDDNALMADNAILPILATLETLRKEYSEAAWEAHSTFCGKFLAERA